jgi:hypothetical protein
VLTESCHNHILSRISAVKAARVARPTGRPRGSKDSKPRLRRLPLSSPVPPSPSPPPPYTDLTGSDPGQLDPVPAAAPPQTDCELGPNPGSAIGREDVPEDSLPWLSESGDLELATPLCRTYPFFLDIAVAGERLSSGPPCPADQVDCQVYQGIFAALL